MLQEAREKFADVYVRYPLSSSFTYIIPNGKDVKPGMRVRVNFRNRNVSAFVHRIHSIEPAGFDLKEIIEEIDPHPIFDSRLVELAEYIASNYICTVGEVLSVALPSGVSSRHRYRKPNITRGERKIRLTEAQRKIYEDIISSSENPFHLIHGITSSGKTEIYIELAKYIIEQNRSVIYLVPEITLSSQIYERIATVFGEQLVIYHSRLTPNQRLNSWMRFYSGDAKIAVGTRSAVFLQCPDLGLIIIDEEHDGSYKETGTPRYNARRVATHRSRMERSLLVMGSATPSIESLYAAEKNVFTLHRLDHRYGKAQLPVIEVVKIEPFKPSDMLSSVLRLYSKQAIKSGNQVILLLNRRGFSPILICNACGEVVNCPFCSISMNYHRDGLMHCHYCGYKKVVALNCETCGSDQLIKLGSGTQRLEEVIEEVLGKLRIFRLDQDSSRKKDIIFELIDKMNSGEIDILLGTQMVAKGFDFHNVSTVGIILADIGINLPDFRSSERIFSLLMQVAGRCGRGELPGRVIVQTLNDRHYIFNFLKNHDYYGFYRYELSVRRMMDYPPFTRITRLLVRGRNQEKVRASIDALKSKIEIEIGKRNASISLLGPAEAPIPKISNNYRYHLLLKSRDIEGVRDIVKSVRDCINEDSYLEIDVDPYDIL